MTRESAELATYITNSIEKNEQLVATPQQKIVVVAPAPTKKGISVSSTSQQTSHSHLIKTHLVPSHKTTTITTQTSQASGLLEACNVNVEIIWQAKLDVCREEMKTKMSEMKAEMSEMRKALDKQITDYEVKCSKLEVEVREEKAEISKLNLVNKEIKFSLSNKNEEYLQLQHAREEQDVEFKKSKDNFFLLWMNLKEFKDIKSNFFLK